MSIVLPPDIEAAFEQWLESEPDDADKFFVGFKIKDLITCAERNVARRAFLHAWNACEAKILADIG